jgi:MFS family permease
VADRFKSIPKQNSAVSRLTSAAKLPTVELLGVTQTKVLPLRPRHFLICALSTLCFAITTALLWMILPAYMLAYQADFITLGLVTGSLGLGVALGSPYFYRLLGRRGPRTVLVFGAVVTLSLPLLHYLSLSPVMLILTRIVMGFGISAFLLALRGLADASYTPERPPWTAKALLFSLLIGLLFGSALGGYLPYVTSFNWAFLISLGPAMLTLFLASGLSEPRRKSYLKPLEKEDRRAKSEARGPANPERLDWIEILLYGLALLPLALVTTRLPMGEDPLSIIASMLIFLLLPAAVVYWSLARPGKIPRQLLWTLILIAMVGAAATISFHNFIWSPYLLSVFLSVLTFGVLLLALERNWGMGALLSKKMANLLTGGGLAVFSGNLLLAVGETWFFPWVAGIILLIAPASGLLALSQRDRLSSPKR